MLLRLATRSAGLAILLGLAPGACVRPSVPAPAARASARAALEPMPRTSSASLAGPPPPGVPPDTPLPPLLHERLENGLEITMLRRGGVPLVALELVLPVGRADDGAKPGTALVCSELLRGHMRTLVPGLEVELDQTRYSYSIASSELAEAMRVLGELAATPPVSRPEFERVRRRWVEKTRALGERDGAWAARAYLYARLYRLPVRLPPGQYVGKLLKGTIRPKLIEERWDDLLRITGSS